MKYVQGKCQVEKAAEVRNKEPGEIVPANRVVEGRRLRHTGRMNTWPPPTEILGASSTAQRTSHYDRIHRRLVSSLRLLLRAPTLSFDTFD